MRSTPLGSPPGALFGVAGFRFSPDVIVLAVRWYPRFGLSYRDVEELLAEREVEVGRGRTPDADGWRSRATASVGGAAPSGATSAVHGWGPDATSGQSRRFMKATIVWASSSP